MPSLGKVLVVLGSVTVLLGVVLMFYDRIPFVGKLPGDISIKRENFELHIPITTSIIFSILLSLIVWVISQFKER